METKAIPGSLTQVIILIIHKHTNYRVKNEAKNSQGFSYTPYLASSVFLDLPILRRQCE
mgnify:CR=1 FL=1